VDERTEVSLLLLARAEPEQRDDSEPGLRAERARKGRRRPDGPGDEHGRHFVEADAACALRHVGAEQAEIAAALDERPRESPILLFEGMDGRLQSLPVELFSRSLDQLLLVAQRLRREDVAGVGLGDQPFAAAGSHRYLCKLLEGETVSG